MNKFICCDCKNEITFTKVNSYGKLYFDADNYVVGFKYDKNIICDVCYAKDY
jgi:hypothetical protein